MNLIKVDELDLPELQIFKSMRDNVVNADESFIADSAKVVNLLIKNSCETRSVLAVEDYYNENADLLSNLKAQFYVASKDQMRCLTGFNIHHGVMMHGRRPVAVGLNELRGNIVMLDTFSKNDNVGAIARTAAAFGVQSYLVPRQGPHPYGRRALRVSMGYVSMMNYSLYDNKLETFAVLKKLSYKIIAIEADTRAQELKNFKVPEKWVVLFGNEGDGLSEEVLNSCDAIVKLDMKSGVKSLNVGAAAAVALYHFCN
jgi:tRNA G18 (ribose-2'-O)-methylase SpoU